MHFVMRIPSKTLAQTALEGNLCTVFTNHDVDVVSSCCWRVGDWTATVMSHSELSLVLSAFLQVESDYRGEVSV